MSDSKFIDNSTRSRFAMGLGIDVKHVSEGRAVLEMKITEEHLNIFGTVHGGALFTMADTAFGIAGNTRGIAVALQANINFLKPAHLGDILTATAEEESLTRSTGVYNVRMENQKGDVVALFRGVTYRKTKEKRE